MNDTTITVPRQWLDQIVEYLWDDESEDFIRQCHEGNIDPAEENHHIFPVIVAIDNLIYGTNYTPLDIVKGEL